MNNQPHEAGLKLVFNIPNTITAVRIILSPVVAVLLLNNEYIVTGIVVIIAAATDGLDGFAARKLGQSSEGGILFDLIADQILFIPNIIIALASGLFSRADNFMFFNPYPFAIVVLAASATLLTAISTYIWKRRTKMFDFPSPPISVKAVYWFWLVPAVLAIFNVGSDLLLAILMYLAIIYTATAAFLYIKKGIYIFTV